MIGVNTAEHRQGKAMAMADIFISNAFEDQETANTFAQAAGGRARLVCLVVAQPMTQSRRVFLAHAREDKERVRTLYKRIKQRGFTPWLDEEDLIPGQVWTIEIQKAIREAGAFVACLSQISVQKQGYVQTEFRLALTTYGEKSPGEIYFIPVRLDECEIPDLQIPNRGLSIRDFHWLDLWQEGGFERLIRALEKGLSTTSRAVLKPGTVFRDTDAPWCPEMVALPAGEFMMGSPGNEKERFDDEGPQNRVTIGRRCAIERYPVTFDEYDHFCAVTSREKPADEGWGRGRRPVINISWRDAVAYCAWLANETGQPYRLPSEAEREYAARAGTTTRYAFGDAITPKDANYSESKLGKTTEVGAYPPNAWGLYDMHGNVWEWVEDIYHDSYKGAPTDGSAWTDGEGEGSSRDRVVRGGSWYDYPGVLRSAIRSWNAPGVRNDCLGFRVARPLY